MDPINDFLKNVERLLQGQISADNENVEFRDVQVSHNVPLEIAVTKLHGKPRMVYASALDRRPAVVGFEVVDQKRVRIQVFFLDQPTDPVQVRVKIEGE